MDIILKNVRAFSDVTYRLGSNGITLITGENSAGKSILTDILDYLFTGAYKQKELRDSSIIKDGEEQAIIGFIHNNKRLWLRFTRNKTPDFQDLYYQEGDGIEIRRTLREGGWEDIFKKFGFDLTFSSSLHIRNVYSKLIGVNTSSSELYTIIKELQSDKNAELFINNYKETYKILNSDYQNTCNKLTTLKRISNTLQLDKKEEIEEAIRYLENPRSKLISKVGTLKYMPPLNVKYINTQVKLIQDIQPNLLSQILKPVKGFEGNENIYNYMFLRDNKECPTCKVSFEA